MSRDGSGVYSKPAGTTAVSGTTIASAQFNSAIDDLVQDANVARPIVAGGTGAPNLSGVKANLEIPNDASELPYAPTASNPATTTEGAINNTSDKLSFVAAANAGSAIRVSDDGAGLAAFVFSDDQIGVVPRTKQPLASTAGVSLIDEPFSTGSHRHFGGCIRDALGRNHIYYRKAAGHQTSNEGTITQIIYGLDGVASSEVDVVANTSGVDHRDPVICVTPTGRIILGYTDVPTDQSEVDDFLAIYSDDNGATWSSPITVDATVNGARLYGSSKVVSQGGVTNVYMTGYYRDAGSTTRTLAIYKSSDDGLTWAEQTPMYSGSLLDRNEFEIEYVTEEIAIGFSRFNGGVMRAHITTDAGATWSAAVAMPWGSVSDVAPSLNKVTHAGEAYLLLSYCDRSTEETVFRWARVSDLTADLAANVANLEFNFSIGSTDMQISSGYQKGYIDEFGNFIFVEFRENTASDTSVRLNQFAATKLIAENVRSWVPTLYGSSTAGSPTFDTNVGGQFVKRGSLVHISAYVKITAKGGMVGSLRLTDLPFPVASGASSRANLSVSFFSGASLPAATMISAFLLDDYIGFYRGGTTGTSPVTDTEVSSSFAVYLSGTYRTDA